MNKLLSSVLLIGLFVCASVNAENQDLLTLTWEDLIPENAKIKNPMDELTKEEYYALTDDEYQSIMEDYQAKLEHSIATASVVSELNGKVVTLSGYAVPLDFEADKVHEFLLVPYFGACIHVPPPPLNQTVFVRVENGTDLNGLWDAISVTGEMETTHISTDLAHAGYQIQADKIKPYSEELSEQAQVH